MAMKKLNIPLMLLLFTVWLIQACGSTRGASSTTDTGTGGNGTITDTTRTATNTTGNTDNTTVTDNNTGDNTSTPGVNTDKTDSTTITGAVSDDSLFVVQAVSIGMKEVELGQLAQKKAQSESVRNFSAMMIRDHSKSNAQLRSLAMSKNITLPASTETSTTDSKSSPSNIGDNSSMESGNATASSDTAGHYMSMLSKKSGIAFDREYIRMMIDDHSKAISLFEGASTTVMDNDIKAYVNNTLPVLRTHLEQARIIGKKLNMGTVSSNK